VISLVIRIGIQSGMCCVQKLHTAVPKKKNLNGMVVGDCVIDFDDFNILLTLLHFWHRTLLLQANSLRNVQYIPIRKELKY